MRSSWLSPVVLLAAFAGCREEKPARLVQPVVTLPSGWIETPLVASNDDPADVAFGAATALFEDTAVIGMARFRSGNGRSGAVQAVLNDAGSWNLGATLLPSEPLDASDFGSVLALTRDFLAVGAPAVSGGPGSVWVLERAASAFGNATAVPLPVELESEDARFGVALALEGTTLLVGAPNADGPLAEVDAGSVYAYQHDGGGWHLAEKLQAPAASAGAHFGATVVLHGDLAVIGAPGRPAIGAGAAYIFTHHATWQLQAGLESPIAPAAFGSALAVTDDRLFVGSPNQAEGSGAVQVFKRSASWSLETERLPAEGTIHDYFGSALGVSRDRLFVGAPNAYSGPVDQVVAAGSVQVFALDDDLTYQGMLTPSDGEESDSFGQNIAIADSNTLLVGATGKAYVFSRQLGSACTTNFDCGSQSCVEGVCCESSCTGGCKSCLAVNHPGDGTNGVCRPITEGHDPKDACDGSETECGTTGSCDGQGACAFQASGTGCGAVGCANDTMALTLGHCDGKGMCQAPPVDCDAGYLCRDGACAVSCDDDSACGEGYYCLDAACVTGVQCTQDGGAEVDANGFQTTCSLGKCHDGHCADSCQHTSECVGDLVCDPYHHRCANWDDLMGPEPGCAIVASREVRDASRWPALLALIVAAQAIYWRRSARGRCRREHHNNNNKGPRK